MSERQRSESPSTRPASLLAFYWRVAVKPHWQAAAPILGFALGSAVLDVLTIGLTVPLLDALTRYDQAAGSRVMRFTAAMLERTGIAPTTGHALFVLLAAMSLLFLARSGLFLLSQHATTVLGVRLRHRTKVALLDRYLHGGYEDVSARSRGAVLYDIRQPSEALCSSIINLGALGAALFNAVIMVAWLLSVSWWVTVVIGLLAVGGVQSWRWFVDRRSAAYGRTLYALRAEEDKLQIDAIDGLKVVKAHGLEPRMVRGFDQLLASEERPELRLSLFKNAPMLVNEAVAAAIVLVLGAVTFLMPSSPIRFSLLAAFLLGIRRIAPATATINGCFVMLSRNRREIEMIEQVLCALPQERRGGRPLERIRELWLEAVTFAYRSRAERLALDGVSAAIRTGTVTAVVGSTGSGKSTLANLVVGFYAPSSGAIRVNGVDLAECDLQQWRSRIGYVCQDVFVFNTTIRENILLGDEQADAVQMEWAARVAQLHDFIVSLPEGYDTVIGDRGVRLSGGQCQRLAIARAILKRPEVLIFDEATSALDNVTERAVYDAISQLRREAMVIVIAHRLSTVKDADQLLVLESGRLMETGTHEALMKRGGLYAKLYSEHERTSAEAPSGSAADEMPAPHGDPAPVGP